MKAEILQLNTRLTLPALAEAEYRKAVQFYDEVVRDYSPVDPFGIPMFLYAIFRLDTTYKIYLGVLMSCARR